MESFLVARKPQAAALAIKLNLTFSLSRSLYDTVGILGRNLATFTNLIEILLPSEFKNFDEVLANIFEQTYASC